MSVLISKSPIDVSSEIEKISRDRTDIGAVVTFTGICRGDEQGVPIDALTLEHYPDMANTEIGRHIDKAKSRWPLIDVRVVHRVGRIKPGEIIVAVLTASAHRQAAFSAAEFIMDYLKTHAPFWKKIEQKDGNHWVEARESDDAASERWKTSK